MEKPVSESGTQKHMIFIHSALCDLENTLSILVTLNDEGKLEPGLGKIVSDAFDLSESLRRRCRIIRKTIEDKQLRFEGLDS